MSVTAVQVINGAKTITQIVGEIAAFGVKANNMPAVHWAAEFAAGLIPGGGVILKAVDLALPFIVKAAAAAPQIMDALNSGLPIAQAFDEHAPAVITHLKSIFAIAVNHDPERAETNLTAADIGTDQALTMFGNIFQRSFFSPQDPRFDRVNNNGG